MNIFFQLKLLLFSVLKMFWHSKVYIFATNVLRAKISDSLNCYDIVIAASSLGLAGRMNHRRIFIGGGAVTNVCLIPTPFYAFLPRFGILVPGILDVNNTPML